MTTFTYNFNNNLQDFAAWVKNARVYNQQLEKVYIAIVGTIQTDFWWKPITRAFVNRVLAKLPKDSCNLHLEKSDFRDTEYTLRIELTGKDLPLHNKYAGTFITTIDFREASATRTGTLGYGMVLNQSSIIGVVNAINTNRKRMHSYEDALKHAKSQTKKATKAAEKFIRTMEEINPMFVDMHAVNSIDIFGNLRYHYMAYENKIAQEVELYTPENVN